MSSLMTAMDKQAEKCPVRVLGENGRAGELTTGNPILDAFGKVIRNCPSATMDDFVGEVVRNGFDEGLIEDAFVLWAEIRGVRGGKGEKKAAMMWLQKLAAHFPDIALEMVPLMPEYGSWKDLIVFIADPATPEDLRSEIERVFVQQLREDDKRVEEQEEGRPSLAMKWGPREKGAFKSIAKSFARALFPDSEQPYQEYRQMLVRGTARLDVPEVKMASHQWAKIKPGAVPAKCLTLHRNAFLNKKGKKGEQRSHEEDRVQCAENFLLHAQECLENPGKASMHGRANHPHEIAEKCEKLKKDDPILEAQWVDLRERVRKEAVEKGGKNGSLGKMVAMVDVSGSMHGIPMLVAKTVGVLISEVADPAFRNRVLTFSKEPDWHSLDPRHSLREKLQHLGRAPWGMNTDFKAALKKVLDACVEHKVPPEEVGQISLVVLSDMQFDASQMEGGGGYGYSYGRPRRSPNWETQHEELVRMFAEAGKRSAYKKPYPVPRVIYWNLRADTCDFPVQQDTKGVDIVSGFSANLLEVFMTGDDLADANNKKSPLDTMREVLDNPRYDPVREACRRVLARVGREPPCEESEEEEKEKEEEEEWEVVD